MQMREPTIDIDSFARRHIGPNEELPPGQARGLLVEVAAEWPDSPATIQDCWAVIVHQAKRPRPGNGTNVEPNRKFRDEAQDRLGP